MSEYEVITGELRGAMEKDENRVQLSKCLFEYLCDNIDSVHRNLERENESLRRELDRVTGEMDEHHAWAPESHYMMLPKDAKGEPVHVGDVMEWPDGPDEPFEVVGIGENGTLFYMYDESCEWTNASTKRHHRADTWERIIKDAIGEGMARERCREKRCDHSGALSNADLVARCRALAGDVS